MPPLNINLEAEALLQIASGKVTEKMCKLETQAAQLQDQVAALSNSIAAVCGVVGVKPSENPIPAIIALKEAAAELESLKNQPLVPAPAVATEQPAG